ncbi:hypothetical protein DFH11DRAFT_1264501 [Phellopilus nigrolimitatus]|nr:hypothetical protein DFH11DRAFT_1264501 [Phellopilus nigrolimitatus]
MNRPLQNVQSDLKVVDSSDTKENKCQIHEILQHICEIKTEKGAPEVHCFPIPRIFRICPNRPAVEITRSVTIDSATGEVILPTDATTVLPKGKPWWAVTRNMERSDIQSGT